MSRLSWLSFFVVGITFAHAAATVDVCGTIARRISDKSQVFRPGDSQYASDIEHFALSAEQNATCVVEPACARDVATILQILANDRTKFAVKSGGHNLNPGFSSTSGVQISMSRFNQLKYNPQTSTVEVGSGMIWDDVYNQLQAHNVSVVGARAPGIGVGGFIVAGGGYSYKTNQYGLAADNVLSMEVVLPDGLIKTVSRLLDRELFFALRGGGNNFGVVTKFTLKTHPQTDVWGGSIIYPATEFATVSAAVLNYTSNNTDIKTGLQCTFATLQGQGIIMVNLFYDAPIPPPGLFDSFLDITSISFDISTRSYLSLVQSANTDLTAGLRGIYNTISHTDVTETLVNAMQNETTFFASMLQSNGLVLNGYVIEPFLPEAYHHGDTDTAYPPNRNENIHPMNIYYAWANEESDTIMLKASRQTAASLQQIALSNGILASAKYPNYAIFQTPLEEMYGGNLPRLRAIKRLVDPFDVMGSTGGFKL
ncbi:FAD-binding domain-containing protein [Dendrothele bispora CBS 962.96]|uniref:FAD-binding domain-containing protein n=1 Tax=Dendrothele bispora (strain CBS 962.96) TaxID=1314807 RepID=A0A4S8L447_DENBC|nr:FAD-binding domain-containing protein [Dendrothele bispora CBS 962.96]